MSYQTEERYWSDYLRIALPIAGLLLLLGVFWYWANSFIGDNDDNPPVSPVVAVQTTPLTAPSPTPSVAATILFTPESMQPTQVVIVETPESGDDGGDDTTGGDENGGDTSSGDFAEGDVVLIVEENDDDVNMRAEPTTEGDIVDTLASGTELRIVDAASVEADGFTWWNVEDTTNEVEGWVAGQFLELVEG